MTSRTSRSTSSADVEGTYETDRIQRETVERVVGFLNEHVRDR